MLLPTQPCFPRRCCRDLAAAKPALDAALAALNSISPKDITSLKALKNPPDVIKRIFDCVLLLRHWWVQAEVVWVAQAMAGCCTWVCLAAAPLAGLGVTHVLFSSLWACVCGARAFKCFGISSVGFLPACILHSGRASVISLLQTTWRLVNPTH
jgi:hypothetical protein